MSEELREVLEIELDELNGEFYEVQEEWAEGWITTGEAIQKQSDIRARMREIREVLTQ